MGQYYDVKAVETNGRRILHHSGEKPPLAFRHRLVAVCDKAIFKLAVDVSDPREYKRFYDQYAGGHLLSFDLYDFQPAEES